MKWWASILDVSMGIAWFVAVALTLVSHDPVSPVGLVVLATLSAMCVVSFAADRAARLLLTRPDPPAYCPPPPPPASKPTCSPTCSPAYLQQLGAERDTARRTMSEAYAAMTSAIGNYRTVDRDPDKLLADVTRIHNTVASMLFADRLDAMHEHWAVKNYIWKESNDGKVTP